MSERIDEERLGRATRSRVLALVSLLVALTAVGLMSLRSLKLATDHEARVIDLLLEMDRFQRALHDAEVGQRDYLLTGNEGGLQRFEDAARELELRRDDMVRAIQEDDLLRPDVESFQEAVGLRLQELRRVVALRRQPEHDAAAIVVAVEESDTAWAVREVRREVRSQIEELARQRAQEVQQSYRVAMINLGIGGILGVIALGALILLMNKNLRNERQNRQELEEQRELLRATLSGITDVVVTTAADGTVRYTNEVGERLLSRRQLEDLGRTIHDEMALGRHEDGEPAAPELRHLSDPEDSAHPFESRTTPMRDRTGTMAGAVTVLRDVSEVRRMRRMVTESEALKSAILDTAFDCIVTVDESGRVIEFNPSACRTFGYERQDVLGRPIGELIVPPELREAGAAGMRRYRETGASDLLDRQVEVIAMRKDGTRFPVEAYISRLTFGGRSCFTGYLRDITERRRNEVARETQIRLLALAADVGAALARPGTLKQVLNDCASVLAAQLDASWVQIWLRFDDEVRICGSTSADATPITEGAHELAGESWVARVVRTGAPAAVSAADWDEPAEQDGGRDGASVVCHPVLLDQRTVGAVVAFLDGESPLSPSAAIASVATEIALGVERLRSEDRVQHLLERERIRAERLEQVSSVAATIHAANTRSSVIGVVREETRRILEAVRAEIEFGEEPPKPAPNELTAPLRGRDGRSIGHLRLFSEHPGEFDRLDRFLLHQLAGMAAVALDNARLYSELQEGARRKDEFLATLAHELRNPLAPIRNALRIMEHSQDDPEVVARYRLTVERQVRHLVRLVDDLLDISRIDRGKLSLRRRRIRLDRVVDAAVEASRPTIEESEHTLTVNVPDEAIEIFADEDRVVQILLNLLNNAAKFTEQGGRIDLTVQADEDTVELCVTDDGIGIAPEALSKIFDLFTQAGRRSDRATGGLGVGLSLVRRLVEMHGGSVDARSAGVGRGSTFTVMLPRAPARSARSAPESPALTVEPHEEDAPRRVLVVDDQHDSADTLAALLRMMGHEVTTAYDGEAAVDRARDLDPDLVFLDIGLPGITGYDAARRIRELPGGDRALLVALTGWGQEEARKRSLEAGFDRHLVKPLYPAALDEVLQLLPRRGTREERNGDGERIGTD